MKGTVCVTGKLNFGTRDAFIKYIESKGWVFVPRVTDNLTYLVTNNPYSGTQKNLRAQAIGATVITEEEFMDILNEDGYEEPPVQVHLPEGQTVQPVDAKVVIDSPPPAGDIGVSPIPAVKISPYTKAVLGDIGGDVKLDISAMKKAALGNPQVEQWLQMVTDIVGTDGTN